jgi:AraC-like DNA-binding protein
MVSPEPFLTVRAVQPLVSGLKAMGHDPRPLLALTGLDEATLRDPDARVPMRLVMSLMARAVDTTGDKNLGLHIAENADVGSADVHFYAIVSSPTLGAAYERVCRYQRLIHETNLVELDTQGDRAWLRHRRPGGLPAPRHTAEFLLAVWVRAGRIATGTDWAPLEVHFAHPEPQDVREHGRFFRASVRFACGENALVLPKLLLDTPCIRADPALLAVLDRYAADRLRRTPQTNTLADRVRTTLAEQLVGTEPGVARLAARLKMSVRTLNRTLASEGTTYRALLDQLRHELATRHLADDRVSIAEVAFLLGFSELSSFYRAFKRWTGRTPVEFRQDRPARGR